MNVFSIWLFHHIILDNIYIMQIYKDLPTTHKDNTHVICVTIDSNEENTDIYGTIAFQANFLSLIWIWRRMRPFVKSVALITGIL